MEKKMKKMTKRQRILGISLAVFGVLTIGLLVGLASISGGFQTSSLFGSNTGAAALDRADDLAGALEYEFNMTKDPATGKIPEGVFEAERAQATDVLKMQRQRSVPEFASYNFVGPDNLGGRTRTVVYDVRYNGTANRTIFAGGVSGGVYKSIDDGATWVRKSPTGDHFSCTSIAQDTRPGFQDVWYYTVGEPIGNSASANGANYSGNGVYKSTDNGESWTRLPASNTTALESFSTNADFSLKLVVDPTNGNVYMAAIAAIRRSTDGGATWETVLNGTLANTSQITDIVVTSNGTFYAGFSGTNTPSAAGAPPADGVFKSSTGALNSWTRIAGVGSPTNPAGWNAQNTYRRVVLAVAPNLESRVYALYYNNVTSSCTGTAAPEAEFYYFDDLTQAWTDISATLPNEAGCSDGNDPFAVQGGYDLVVAVKPDDANTIFIGGTNAYRSTDTGATWTRIGGYNSPANYAQYPNSHPDIHSFVFQPGSPSTMLCGNDGGIQRTTDVLAPTVAWTPINNGYRTYQYYYVANDPRMGNDKVIGGAQDNGTTRNVGGTGSQFESVFGGDGVSVGLSNPAASGGSQFEYVGSQLGNIFRRNAASGANFGTNIKPTGSGQGLFVTLFELDPDNTQTLYYANANTLYRTISASTVTSATWTQLTGVGTAVGTTVSISSIGLTRGAYNAATSSLFIGTTNGRVFRLDDPNSVAAATAAPVEISLGAGFPAGTVSSIAVSPINDDVVMVTFSNYGVPSVFLTQNANAATPTWTNIENNLALPSYRSSAIANVGGTLEYYAGTSTGLYRITDPTTVGAMWTKEGAATIGSAVVSSLDLRTSDNKLLVGTHGIGMLRSAPAAPTAALVSVSGRALTATGRGIRGVRVSLTDASGGVRTATTSTRGVYRFNDVAVGETYVLTARGKRYTFSQPTQIVSVGEETAEINFVANPSGGR